MRGALGPMVLGRGSVIPLCGAGGIITRPGARPHHGRHFMMMRAPSMELYLATHRSCDFPHPFRKKEKSMHFIMNYFSSSFHVVSRQETSNPRFSAVSTQGTCAIMLERMVDTCIVYMIRGSCARSCFDRRFESCCDFFHAQTWPFSSSILFAYTHSFSVPPFPRLHLCWWHVFHHEAPALNFKCAEFVFHFRPKLCP